jgi:DNA helicase-2/ATP-dependent DNA helicase PcrA
MADTDELPAKARNTLLALMRDMARWRDLARTATPAELARVMLDRSGYTAMLQADRSAEARGVWKTCRNWPARWKITRRWAIS